MRFMVDGKELNAERMRVGESCEAEQALGMDITKGSMAALAVSLFVAMRRDNPDKPAHMIADDVMRVELEGLNPLAEDDAGPPDGEPVNGSTGHITLPTTGTPA